MTISETPTARLPFEHGRTPHLPCGPGDVAADVLMPGDPDRVDMLRGMLTDVKDFGRRREFSAVSGYFAGHKFTICSGGIGGPSTEIAMVELAMLGAKRVVRIGGCSALVPEISPGEYIVADTAAGLTGIAALYSEQELELSADPALTGALLSSARRVGVRAYRGRITSTDSYYFGQDRPIRLNRKNQPSNGYLDSFRAQGSLGVEMETQAIFAVGHALGLKVASLLGVHGNRATDTWLSDYENTQRTLLHIAGRALAQGI